MSNPQQETKIELVTEAIEALVLAQTVCLQHPGVVMHKQLTDARSCLRDALRTLLTPTLRVVTNEKIDVVGEASSTKRKIVAETVPYGGKGIDGMNLA
jgi:hypothetical protein